ncbi:MAG: hypothetical protein JW841_12085 [Deltaproteobacteria bacterium]|nr:hypothetical protein [Deltaproteobacteria bacterium]
MVHNNTTLTSTDELYAAVSCLQRLVTAFTERREQLAQAVQLSEQQWQVLEQISSEHFVPSMFAKTRSSSPAAVSKILRQLQNKKLISVSLSTADARQRDYLLTTKGKKTMELIRSERQQAIDAIWAPLNRKQLKTFTNFGNLVASRIEDYAALDKE